MDLLCLSYKQMGTQGRRDIYHLIDEGNHILEILVYSSRILLTRIFFLTAFPFWGHGQHQDMHPAQLLYVAESTADENVS